MESLLHAAEHAWEDTLVILPFLFLVYFLLEMLEHKFSHRTLNLDKFGPFVGSVVGVLPQCGFSIAATTLFNKRVITLGTLLAVYLSTSDEAIPIILSHPDQFPTLVKLVVCKVIIAFAAGTIVDLIAHRQPEDDCYCSECKEPPLPHHHHHHEYHLKSVLLHSAKKTVRIFLFLLVTMWAITWVIELIGENRLEQLLLQGSIFQPLLCGLVGLIPTCVPSIVITQLFLTGSLSFGSAMAGLCASAGMGTLILLKENKEPRRTVQVIGLLYLISVIAGMILNILPL